MAGIAADKLPATKLQKQFEIIELTAEEFQIFKMFKLNLNAGESSCLAVATARGGRVLTDDRDARKTAAQKQIPISGTLGVLVRSVDIKLLTMQEANLFWFIWSKTVIARRSLCLKSFSNAFTISRDYGIGAR